MLMKSSFDSLREIGSFRGIMLFSSMIFLLSYPSALVGLYKDLPACY
jgi:hypothetical protein